MLAHGAQHLAARQRGTDASPSGRACEVRTKRSRCPICRSTSSSMSLCLLSTRFLNRSFAGLASLSCTLQQLFHSRLFPFGPIEAEEQFRGPAQTQPVREFTPDISLGGVQA